MNITDAHLTRIAKQLKEDTKGDPWLSFFALVDDRIQSKTNAVLASRDNEIAVAYERGRVVGMMEVRQFLNDIIEKHGTAEEGQDQNG